MWLSYTTPSMFKVSSLCMVLERFRFEDENEYEHEIQLKLFAHVLKKRHPAEKLHFPFFTKKLVLLFILKEVKPSPDSKMIKLLTSITGSRH